MTEPLRIEFTALASQHVREAEGWWRLNRPAAPNAVREELQQLLPLIAAQPRMGSRATNVKLEGVRRIHIRRIRLGVSVNETSADSEHGEGNAGSGTDHAIPPHRPGLSA